MAGLEAGVIIENFGYMMRGLRITVTLAVIGMACALGLGTLLGLGRLSRLPLISYPAVLYIEMMRGTPLLMVIFWLIFFLPRVAGTALDPVSSGLLALVLFYASHVAEIVRAGIQSIPRGQREAGMASGLGERQTMQYIVLPQAIRNMVPALVSRFVSLFMSTSLTYIIGVVEFFRAATIVNNREFRSMEIFTFVALVYFVCCFVISQFGGWCERRLGAQRLQNLETALGW
jgi:His/Glu/Gln/Arg/opine family amino acid ABC transporter permease subunit